VNIFFLNNLYFKDSPKKNIKQIGNELAILFNEPDIMVIPKIKKNCLERVHITCSRRKNDKSINYMKAQMNSLLGQPRQKWHNNVYRYLN